MNLRSYAKINIGLHVLNKREDGFHNIETIFREIDIFDEIELVPADRLAMTADSILVPIDATNLCIRAALLLQTEYNVDQGVMIHLKKNIPIGAGLGGGSANAATVLNGLNTLWNLHASKEHLRILGAQLGSDVPFFIEGGTAYATGRGEVLEHFALDIPYWILGLTPPIHVSTKWAYGHLKLHRDGTPSDLKKIVTKHIKKPDKLVDLLENDFENSVFQAHPDIHTIKRNLENTGALFALMSGSGSTVFGLFKHEAEARAAIAAFPPEYQFSLTAPTFVPDYQPIAE